MARKSLTLVRVGPVTTWSPSASKKPWPSLSARRALAPIPRPAARNRVSGATTAPAASPAPSTPSVSAASAKTPGKPSNSTARDSRNSTLRPPRPVPFTVTVVSPPDSRTTGGGAGWPRSAAWRAMPAMTLPTSRASPSSASPRMSGAIPDRRATSAAASSESCGEATMTVLALASRGSPGFGVSSAARARWSIADRGSVMPYLSSTARASAKVEASGTVGPEAMTAGSSPGTSEITRVTSRAGWAAAASRPPLMADRCLRTAFISPIGAPERSRAALTACLSARVRPGAGRLSKADPPPEISASTRSSGPSPRTISSMRPAARWPFSSGTGCDASTISIRSQGTAWP